MSRAIHWTKRARQDLDRTLGYLMEQWGSTVTVNFYFRTMETAEQIRDAPLLYPVHDKERNIHRCVLAKQVTLYYRIRSRRIDLLTLWDTRQNPKKLKL